MSLQRRRPRRPTPPSPHIPTDEEIDEGPRCRWCRQLQTPAADDPDPNCTNCGRYLYDRDVLGRPIAAPWPDRRRTPRDPNRRPEHITHYLTKRGHLRPLCDSTWHADTDLGSDDQLVTCPECWRQLRQVRP